MIHPDEFIPIDDVRPTIAIDEDIHIAVDKGIEALSARPNVYQRSNRLVFVARVPQSQAQVDMLEGTPVVYEHTQSALLPELTRAARWRVRNSRHAGGWRDALPSGAVVSAITDWRRYPGIPRLVGTTETPIIHSDGSVLSSPGYDRETGYTYVPSTPFPPIPELPTQDEARAALATLVDVFSDFPHKTPADKYVPVAALLTLLARTIIGGSVPMFLFDANVRGSGKTKQCDAVSLIATGRLCAKMTWATDPEEQEKVLASYARQGASLICFDNIVGSVCGAALDKVLTCGGEVELRVLGASEIPRLPWTAVVMGSGNNLSVDGDTVRRVLMCRLDSQLERPEDRAATEFAHYPLEPWIVEERPRLVCAALTLLRSWILAGRPRMGVGTWGSFEGWAEVVPSVIVYGGGPYILDCRIKESEENGEPQMLLAFLHGFQRLSPDGATLRTIIASLYPEGGNSHGPPDGYDDMREAIEYWCPRVGQAPPSAKKLGEQLRRRLRRWIGGMSLDAVQGSHANMYVARSR